MQESARTAEEETVPARAGGAKEVEPVVVARQAVQELVLPDPAIRTNPSEEHAQLVRVPTWMWLDEAMWQPVSKSVSVPGVSVTATAVPQRAVWRMGDGTTVVCQGPGTAYSARYSADAASPDCGHTYLRSSAGQPREAYRVSVMVQWDVAWHGGGERGVIRGVPSRATTALRVAEGQALVES